MNTYFGVTHCSGTVGALMLLDETGDNAISNCSLEVTHIVTELEFADDVMNKLCFEDDLWCEDTEILDLKWLYACNKTHELVSTEQYKLPERRKVRTENFHDFRFNVISTCIFGQIGEASKCFVLQTTKIALPNGESFPEFACQRATPLHHHNEKFTVNFSDSNVNCREFMGCSCCTIVFRAAWKFSRQTQHFEEVTRTTLGLLPSEEGQRC